MNYIGNKCISCQKEFTEDSDIVVCPQCGTPYHRECYEKEGKCINTVLHQENSAWKPEKKEISEDKIQICHECNAENKNTSLFCENCGKPLNTSENSENIIYNIHNEINEQLKKEVCDRMNLNDEETDGVKMYEMAYFVKSNVYYYLSAFKKFNNTNKRTSMNFLCFLVPYYFFSNRKMYMWSIVTFIVITLLSVPECICIVANQTSGANVDFINTNVFRAIVDVSNFLIIAFKAVISFVANWLYYRHTIKSVKNIKSSFPENQWNYNIMRQGGTSFISMVFTLFVEISVMMIIMSVITSFISF